MTNLNEMKINTDKIRVTTTNYSSNGSKWNGVSVYHDGILIARVKTTARYGSLNYIQKHPNSKYTHELIDKLRYEGVPEWKISAIIA